MVRPRAMEESGEDGGGGGPLPEDLVVEVLRRLPYRSLCRARCVCKSWRDLSYHPDHRWRLPQDLCGLLYTNRAPSRRAHGGSGSFFRFVPAGSSPFPGLGFLPCGARARPLDCCNGLLLCRGGGGADRCYYVCNPAIGKFTALPKPASGFQALALASVDPHGALPRFHVLNFARPEPVPRGLLAEEDESWVQGLEVFSSQTGKWARSHACSESRFSLVEGMGSVFVNGFVNLLTHEKRVLSVDPEGRACRLIFLPVATWFRFGCLGQSQGFLQYAVQENRVFAMMEVWTLTDFEEGDWVLKHRFDIEVAPPKDIMRDYAGVNRGSEVFYVVVFHPEKDLVFLPVEYKLLSYNLITAEVKEVCMLDPKRRPRFLVYVPSYVDLPNLW